MALHSNVDAPALLKQVIQLAESKPSEALALLSAACDGMRLAKTSPATLLAVPELERWSKLSKLAAASASDPARSNTDRALALKVAATESWAVFQPIAKDCLQQTQPAELQLALLDALNTYREPEVASAILDAWPTLTPALREKAMLVLLSRTDRIPALLEAMEGKRILPTQLSAAAKAALQRQKAPQLVTRISKVLGAAQSNRTELIARYLRDMPAQGDAGRGQAVYRTACMACHRSGREGGDLGPHLGTVKAWTAEQLLTNILDPNREVSPNFALYLIELRDGRSLAGIITGETDGTVQLRLADASTQALPRSEIRSLSTTGASLMPEGLEAAVTPAQMADLVAFLRQ
jgi:putative heme-binding domain-containing protein